jgi:F-type H+-transporting ATPase subunit delta
MKISKQSRRDAKALFNACRVEGVLDDSRVRTAVTQLIALKPRGFEGTLDRLKRLVKLDLDRRSALVESATPLNESSQQDVKARLEKLHGAGLQYSFQVNAALVGGLRIRVGSDIYDGSVAGRLQALETTL